MQREYSQGLAPHGHHGAGAAGLGRRRGATRSVRQGGLGAAAFPLRLSGTGREGRERLVALPPRSLRPTGPTPSGTLADPGKKKKSPGNKSIWRCLWLCKDKRPLLSVWMVAEFLFISLPSLGVGAEVVRAVFEAALIWAYLVLEDFCPP